MLDGVTTNPTLIAREGVDYGKRLAEICEVVKGPVSAEVIAQFMQHPLLDKGLDAFLADYQKTFGR